MAGQTECGNAISVWTDGYVVDKGECGTALSLASGGYVIEIERKGGGRFDIRIKERPGLKGGGGHIFLTVAEEEEEILAVIALFLEFDKRGLL